MSQHHGRDGDPERVRAEEGVPGGVGEEQGLDAELDRGDQRGAVDAHVRSDCGGDELVLLARSAASDEAIHAVADERQHEGHVEAVGAEGEHAAVTEEHGLDGEGDAHREHGRPRAEEDGDEGSADGVAGGPARHRDVEHHGEKREGRGDAEEGHLLGGDGLANPPYGMGPDGNHDEAEHAAGRGAEVVFRYVHGSSSREVVGGLGPPILSAGAPAAVSRVERSGYQAMSSKK